VTTVAPPTPIRLLAGLLIGLSAGMTIRDTAAPMLATALKAVGALWLDALTMTVVPLVGALLVTGVAAASRQAAAGGTTARALAIFAAMLTAACLIAAGIAEASLRIWPTGVTLGATANLPQMSPANEAWYAGIIPPNPIKAAAETAMVPLVVFSLFLGFALASIAEDRAAALLKPLAALAEAMLVIVGWVLRVAPLGIAALAFGAGAKLGAGAFGLLGQYVAVVAGCCLAATLLGYLWAVLAGRVSPLRFARAAFPAQAVALGTQSSLACLPVMVSAAERLGVAGPTADITLPLAVSLFRAASAAANVAVTVYLAHAHGIALGADRLLLVAIIAVPVSLGAVGLPAQVSFFATIAPLCVAAGVPTGALPLLLAIEAIPDLFRTLGNVTNDIAAACVIGRRERQ
jgi:Na+/H+-dicarboxylate symporter